jgi:LmbE family N-acetylglucosaminyl deacetylase
MQLVRILVLGAHPDDADLKAGGTCSLWRRAGHSVLLVSVTDGSAGHHRLSGAPLSARRREEARAAGQVIGAEYRVLDFPDAGLMPTLEARHALIRLIRSFAPDVILTHRLNDYHPDHRTTAMLVQDASYLLTVPSVCPEVPHLPRMPVILYLSDDFQKPTPFHPDVVVDIGPEMDRVIEMVHRHTSQFYEWLPYNYGFLDQVPEGEEARKAWVGELIRHRIRPLADRYRERLIETYGYGHGQAVEYIEAFEVSEYGGKLDAEARARLFPFLPREQGPAPEQIWEDVRDDE